MGGGFTEALQAPRKADRGHVARRSAFASKGKKPGSAGPATLDCGHRAGQEGLVRKQEGGGKSDNLAVTRKGTGRASDYLATHGMNGRSWVSPICPPLRVPSLPEAPGPAHRHPPLSGVYAPPDPPSSLPHPGTRRKFLPVSTLHCQTSCKAFRCHSDNVLVRAGASTSPRPNRTHPPPLNLPLTDPQECRT